MNTLIKKNVFSSPYTEYKERNGQLFEILRELTEEESPDKEEIGSQYLIRFEDGTEIVAWPEEILLNN